MLLQMGPFHALKGKVEHNDDETDVAMAHCFKPISEGEFKSAQTFFWFL